MEWLAALFVALATLWLVILTSRDLADQAELRRLEKRLDKALTGEIHRRTKPYELPHVHKTGNSSSQRGAEDITKVRP